MSLNGKHIIIQLDSTWRDIAATNGLTREISYRIEKLITRLAVIIDKIFVKTVKASEILFECLQLTEQLKTELDKHHEHALSLLTRMENKIDDLVKQTHDFRIKAG